MSDLAPFVAAVLRDKVVAELREENEEQQKRSNYAHLYEIGSKDSPATVYAEGHLQEARSSSPNLFVLDLTQAKSCPLRDCDDIQILVGGSHKVDFRQLLPSSRLEAYQVDNDNSKVFILSGATPVYLRCSIDGWPREHWEQFLGRNFRSNQMQDFLKETVAPLYPNATITFHSLALYWKNEQKAIRNLPEPARSRVLREMGKCEG